MLVRDALDVEEEFHRLPDDARRFLEVDLPGPDRQGLEFELERRAGAGPAPAPPWPEEVGQLIDGEDPLLVVAPDRLRGHPVEQAEVIVGLGLGAALGAERAEGAVAVQDDRRGRRVSIGHRPDLIQDRCDLPMIVGEDDLVGDAVEGDDLAVNRRASPDQPQDMPREREGESLVIGDAVRTGDHLRAVGMALRRRGMIDPHQDVAGRREVARSQVRADEVTVPVVEPVLVVSHGFVAIPTQSARDTVPDGPRREPGRGTRTHEAVAGRPCSGGGSFPGAVRVSHRDFGRDEISHVDPLLDRGGAAHRAVRAVDGRASKGIALPGGAGPWPSR